MQQTGPTGQTLQSENMPLEIYMEGNVVFRQGNRIIQAPAMYYDVRQKIGVVLNAELLTPLPTAVYPGLVRLRANVLRQVDQDRYVGEVASFTTSRMGDPTYEVRADQLVFEDSQHPEINVLTGAPKSIRAPASRGSPMSSGLRRTIITSTSRMCRYSIGRCSRAISSAAISTSTISNSKPIRFSATNSTRASICIRFSESAIRPRDRRGTRISTITASAARPWERISASTATIFFDIPGKTSRPVRRLGHRRQRDRRPGARPPGDRARGRPVPRPRAGQYRQQLPNDWQITAEIRLAERSEFSRGILHPRIRHQ